MWGLDDLKKTRAYQEAEQAGREKSRTEILSIAVPLLLERGMTVEGIAQHLELSIATIQQFVPES